MQTTLLTIREIRKNWQDAIVFGWYIALLLTMTLSVKKLIRPVYVTDDTQVQLNEFASIFVYASDIAMIGLLVSIFILKNKYNIKSNNDDAGNAVQKSNFFAQIKEKIGFFWIGFGGIAMLALVSAVFAEQPGVALYRTIHLLLMILTGIVIAQKIVPRGTIRELTMKILLGLGVMHAAIGVVQFIARESLGLTVLRESIIGIDVPGVAKVSINGEVFVRAYGLMPHANILAGFLIVTIAATLVLWNSKKEKRMSKIVPRGTIGIFGLVLVVQILGLTLTMSRSAFLATFCVVVAYFGGKIMKNVFHVEQFLPKMPKKSFWSAILGILSIGIATIVMMYSAKTANIHAGNDYATQSLAERDLYNYVAQESINANPLFGTHGLSITSTIEKFVKHPEIWQHQPVHNSYLVMIAEHGIVIMASIVIFVGALLWNTKKSSKIVPRGTILIFGAVIALSIISIFDHYTITVQQGIWMVIFAIILWKVPQKQEKAT